MPPVLRRVNISAGKLSFRKKAKEQTQSPPRDTIESAVPHQNRRLKGWFSLSKHKRDIAPHAPDSYHVSATSEEPQTAGTLVDTAAIVDQLIQYIDRIVDERSLSVPITRVEPIATTLELENEIQPEVPGKGDTIEFATPATSHDTPPAYEFPPPGHTNSRYSLNSVSVTYEKARQFNVLWGAERYHEARKAVLEYHLSGKKPKRNSETLVGRPHENDESTEGIARTEEEPSSVFPDPANSEPLAFSLEAADNMPGAYPARVEEPWTARHLRTIRRTLHSFVSIFLNIVVIHSLLLRIPVMYAFTNPDMDERRISRSPDAASDLVTLSNEWPEFINRRSVEWKTISGLAAVMLSVILTLLQVSDAGNNAVTRATALTSFMSALCSLLSAGYLLFCYCNSSASETVPQWIKQKSCDKDTIERCSPFIPISFPIAGIFWSLVFFLISMLSFIWQPVADEQNLDKDANPLSIPERAGLSILCGICFVVLGLAVRGYGGAIIRHKTRSSVA